ncbi:MAG: DnaJ domain-containing protein [Candidatus Woykebacteria bacterium]
MDHYKRLGIPRDADASQVRSAYRREAKKVHPDLGGDAENFKKVQEAYKVLSDPERRMEYDRELRFRELGHALIDSESLPIEPASEETLLLIEEYLSRHLPWAREIAEKSPEGIGRISIEDEKTFKLLNVLVCVEPDGRLSYQYTGYHYPPDLEIRSVDYDF